MSKTNRNIDAAATIKIVSTQLSISILSEKQYSQLYRDQDIDINVSLSDLDLSQCTEFADLGLNARSTLCEASGVLEPVSLTPFFTPPSLRGYVNKGRNIKQQILAPDPNP